MRNLRPLTVAAALAIAVTGCSSNDRPTEQEIAGLFDQWNAALASGDSGTVANLSAADGVFLPTLSPVQSNRDQIKGYFEDGFLPKKPQGSRISGFSTTRTPYTVGTTGSAWPGRTAVRPRSGPGSPTFTRRSTAGG